MAATRIVTPALKGSVLETFRKIKAIFLCQFIFMSSGHKHVEESKKLRVGLVYSDTRNIPKNDSNVAAVNMSLSKAL